MLIRDKNEMNQYQETARTELPLLISKKGEENGHFLIAFLINDLSFITHLYINLFLLAGEGRVPD